MIDRTARERRVAELLDHWPWEWGGVVIGGYAVAAYGSPRYSNDLDVVIPVTTLRPLTEWLAQQGFDAQKVPENLVQNYLGRIARLERDSLIVDLLPGAVRDREAQVDIPEAWITKSPVKLRLILLNSSTRNEIPVVRPEAFTALKLQAGRQQDLSDLFAIRNTPINSKEIHNLFENMWCDTLEAKLVGVLEKLEYPKTFHDTRSRLSLGSPDSLANQREWEKYVRKIRAMIPDC